MATNLEDLAARILHLEDIEAIKKLKAKYCDFCNGGWPAKGGTHAGPIAELFVQDGIWDARPGMPIAQGRDAIKALFEQVRAIPFAFHPVTNPVIEIDGDKATGKWLLVGAGTMPGGISGLMMGGYEDEYVRTTEGWRFKSSRPFVAAQGAFPEGWAIVGQEDWAPELKYG